MENDEGAQRHDFYDAHQASRPSDGRSNSNCYSDLVPGVQNMNLIEGEASGIQETASSSIQFATFDNTLRSDLKTASENDVTGDHASSFADVKDKTSSAAAMDTETFEKASSLPSASDNGTIKQTKQHEGERPNATSDVASSDVISDAQEDDVSCHDFSDLPHLVWVKVFQLLPLSDRGHLAQVNWFLNSIFYDGSVWRRATINFIKVLVHSYFFMARYRLSLSEKDKRLAWKFGHYYRDVTLRVRGRPEELEDDTRQILNKLQQKWRLESLTLDIGDREWGNRYQGSDSVNLSLLLEVATLIRESAKLRSLQVLHWPQCYLITEDAVQLGEMLSLGEFHKLRSLRLPRTTENGSETVRAPRDLAVDCVTKFRCLRHVYVTSSVLSDALFKALSVSRDAHLQTLSIEVCGLWSTGDLNHLMTPLVWDTLTSRNPGLEVSMTMNADVPAFAFARFLVPDIPLVSMTFDINCHCYRKAIQLLEQYADTLRQFQCLSHPQDCEMELLSMVRACPKLRHLTFHGDLSDLYLLELAECDGRRWVTFQFVWSRIEKTAKRPTPFNLVAVNRRDLDLDLDLTEEEVKDEFCRQVSQRLGYPWQPEVS